MTRNRFNVRSAIHIRTHMDQGQFLAQFPKPLSRWHRYYTDPFSLTAMRKVLPQHGIPGAEQVLSCKIGRNVTSFTVKKLIPVPGKCTVCNYT